MHLRNAAFAESVVSASLHVPPGFDATRKPGVVVYFHGWQSCAAAVMSDADVACHEGGERHTAGRLASQLDAARVNALALAVELRPEMPTGETGHLADPGGLRALLREVLEDQAATIGCFVDVDALDRVVVVAHSGGYQAAAAVATVGDVPALREIVLLDALYGGDDVFARWLDGSDARTFVDLYTCCAGTGDASRRFARRWASRRGVPLDAVLDDGEPSLRLDAGSRVRIARVPEAHGALPAVYLQPLLAASGFARVP